VNNNELGSYHKATRELEEEMKNAAARHDNTLPHKIKMAGGFR